MLYINNEAAKPYIDEVTEKGGIIHWEYISEPGYILIVKRAYSTEKTLSDVVDTINDKGLVLQENEEIMVDNETSCRLIRNIQRKCAYRVQSAPSLYAVYACEETDGGFVVFQEANKYKNECIVDAVVTYKIEFTEETRTDGKLFWKTETKCKFAKVSVEKNDKYVDGALSYRFDDCPIVFPISQELVGQPFYIKCANGKTPVFFSGIKGFSVERR